MYHLRLGFSLTCASLNGVGWGVGGWGGWGGMVKYLGLACILPMGWVGGWVGGEGGDDNTLDLHTYDRTDLDRLDGLGGWVGGGW